MTAENSQIVLRRSDIEIGKPLSWPVFDRHHHLVFKQGHVVETQTEIDGLLAKGLFRERQAATAAASRRDGRTGGGESAAGDQPAEQTTPFDEIKLAIGDPFQIQAQSDQTEPRYYVRLVGYLKGQSVLVTIPEVSGRLCYVREGQAFVVRFFAGKNAYAFTAHVMRSSSIPFPHMHLTYPSMVRGLVVRAGERVPVRIICSISMRDDTRTVTAAGCMTNLSVSGAMLASKTRLGQKGDLIAIKFRLMIREIEVLTAIDATIRSLAHDETGEFLHGVQFAGLPNDVAIALTAFVYQKLAESAH